MSIPPESILVNPQEIINACEDAEINASLSPSNAAATNSTSTSTSSDGAANGASSSSSSAVPSLDIVLVTQLAALLHTRQYDHARHLYRRYACIVEGETDANANANENGNVASAPMSISLPQFGALWKAAKPWMMGHAQTQFLNDNESSSGSDTTNSICDVFSSLQDCITVASNSNANIPVQPLATYAGQLQTSLRDTMTNTTEELYECITPSECARLLGYANANNDNGSDSDTNGNEGMSEYLQGRNWATEQGKKQGQVVWIPCNSNSKERSNLEESGSDHG
eukprot:180523_1